MNGVIDSRFPGAAPLTIALFVRSGEPLNAHGFEAGAGMYWLRRLPSKAHT